MTIFEADNPLLLYYLLLTTLIYSNYFWDMQVSQNYLEQDVKMYVESIIHLDDSDDESDLDESTEKLNKMLMALLM